jgi:hypothetical protein
MNSENLRKLIDHLDNLEQGKIQHRLPYLNPRTKMLETRRIWEAAPGTPAVLPLDPNKPKTPNDPAVMRPDNSILSLGQTGPKVKELQKRLGIPETGTYDQATKSAVIQLQKELKVAPDGKYGPITRKAHNNIMTPAGAANSSDTAKLTGKNRTKFSFTSRNTDALDAPKNWELNTDPNDPYANTKRQGNRVRADGKTVEDALGNVKEDYTEWTGGAVFTAKLGLKSPGSFADELQTWENSRGTGYKVIQSWQYNNSTLAIAQRPRDGIYWIDMTKIFRDGNLEDYGEELKKALGYELKNDQLSSIKTPLGNTVVEVNSYVKPGKHLVVVETQTNVAIESSQGIHIITLQANYIGPAKDYGKDGEEQFDTLLQSINLVPGLKKISP